MSSCSSGAAAKTDEQIEGYDCVWHARGVTEYRYSSREHRLSTSNSKHCLALHLKL